MKFKKKELSDEIPTSSMADIAFLLIIYFMVTATFAATRGLDYALPEDPKAQTIEPEESVLVEIRADGALSVDGKDMTKEGLFEYLQPKLERNPHKPVILRPLRDASYGSMIEVYDFLRKVKIKRSGQETPQIYQISMAEFRKAQESDNLSALGSNLNIALPTQREIDAIWQ